MYVTEMAEWLDTMTCVKLSGFWSQVEASHVSTHTEELRYNQTVCPRVTVYIYIYIYIMLCVNMVLCIHHMDPGKADREKAWRNGHKNASSYI